MESNMRNLPADQVEGSQPTVVKGKLYASTQGQQDQLAEFAAILGTPVPEQHKPAKKTRKIPAKAVAAEAVYVAPNPEVIKADDTAAVVVKVDGEELDVSGLTKVGSTVVDLADLTTPDTTPEQALQEAQPTYAAAEPVRDSVSVMEAIRGMAGADVVIDGKSIGNVADPAELSELHDKHMGTIITDPDLAAAEFVGFEVPDGTDLMMLMLHPRRDEHGKVSEVPQIQVRCNRAEWKAWVKDALTHGLTHGSVLADDGVTELTGFSIMVDSPDGSERKRLGFVFTQLAAMIPFRDVDELMLRREQENADRAAKAKKLKAKKAKARKQQSQSRRNNR